MKNSKWKNMVICALLLALGLILPFLTGQLRQIGHMLLPMHIPVLFCGLICGKKYGFVVGFITPIFRSFIFSMPVMYPNAVAMAFELAAYGFFSGLFYSKSKKKSVAALYLSIIPAMLIGRIIWGISENVLLGFSANSFTLSAFVTRAFLNGLPGITIQLILIPILMLALGRTRLTILQENSE